MDMNRRLGLKLMIPQPCQTCLAPSILACPRCKNYTRDRPHLTTYYCSEACQQHNRPAHALFCRQYENLWILDRAANMSQALFVTTRDISFDTHFAKVEGRGSKGRMIIRKGFGTGGETTFKLPYTKSNNEDDMRMLMWSGGPLATARFQRFLCSCLEDRLEWIQEMVFTPETDRSLIVVRGTDGHIDTIRQHVVFRLQMKHDHNQYAVDLVGNQFGLIHPVATWHEYEAMMGLEAGMCSSKPSAWSAGEYEELEKGTYAKLKNNSSYAPTNEELGVMFQGYVTGRMYVEINRWTKEHSDTNMREVVQESEREDVEGMVDRVMNGINQLVKYVKAGGGILVLDKLVRATKSAESEKTNLSFHDVQLSKGLMYELNQHRSHLWP